MHSATLLSLGLYMVAMLGIGFYAWRHAENDLEGYMLGGRQLGPAVTALSAGASDMSGWLLLGLPGALYLSGLSQAWIAIGLFIGAYANYLIVAPRLRIYTERAGNAITIPEFFHKRFGIGDNNRGGAALRMVSAAVIILFFTLYTSSGMVSGGKLFESAFGLDYRLGLWLTASVVLIYTLFGGFLAVSLTDVVQGIIMFIALILVPLVALNAVGGVADATSILRAIDPKLLSFTSGVTVLGIVSAASWGLGYFGQPHIIVRFMAIRSVRDLPVARRIGMGWMGLTLAGALATGVIGRAYAQRFDLSVADPETIFILLGQALFHPLIVGFLLAAILAAVMSTISAQLLVTSSSLTEDVYALFLRRNASDNERVLVGRACVLLVALVAILLALDRTNSVLALVANAWAGFGAAFGPAIILCLCWRQTTWQGTLAGMVAGAATVLVWVFGGITIDGTPLSAWIYEIVPGFAIGLIATVIVSRLTPAPSNDVTALFDAVAAERRAA